MDDKHVTLPICSFDSKYANILRRKLHWKIVIFMRLTSMERLDTSWHEKKSVLFYLDKEGKEQMARRRDISDKDNSMN
jgi:hypothetical protein